MTGFRWTESVVFDHVEELLQNSFGKIAAAGQHPHCQVCSHELHPVPRRRGFVLVEAPLRICEVRASTPRRTGRTVQIRNSKESVFCCVIRRATVVFVAQPKWQTRCSTARLYFRRIGHPTRKRRQRPHNTVDYPMLQLEFSLVGAPMRSKWPNGLLEMKHLYIDCVISDVFHSFGK